MKLIGSWMPTLQGILKVFELRRLQKEGIEISVRIKDKEGKMLKDERKVMERRLRYYKELLNASESKQAIIGYYMYGNGRNTVV